MLENGCVGERLDSGRRHAAKNAARGMAQRCRPAAARGCTGMTLIRRTAEPAACFAPVGHARDSGVQRERVTILILGVAGGGRARERIEAEFAQVRVGPIEQRRGDASAETRIAAPDGVAEQSKRLVALAGGQHQRGKVELRPMVAAPGGELVVGLARGKDVAPIPNVRSFRAPRIDK